MAATFPKCGVKLSYILGEFLDYHCGGRDAVVNLTTEQVCEQIIKPITRDEGKISFCELLRREEHPAYGATANLFVSHAHQCAFCNVLSALEYNLKDRLDTVVVWFDIFSINQHQTNDWTFDWLCHTFQSSIKEFGHTIMVMSPWNDPIPFTRAWCILEAYWTCATSSKFEIAMGETDRLQFLNDVSKDVDHSISNMHASIQAENSQCSKDEDRQQIFSVINSSTVGGFGRINSQVFEQYRTWVIEVAKEAMQQCDNDNNDEKRLHYMRILGNLYSNQGKQEHATAYLVESYEKCLATKGIDDHSTLSSMYDLAFLYFRKIQHKKAIDLCEICFEKRKSILGELHEETLRSMSLLAMLYKSQFGYKKAGTLFEDCLAKRRNCLGEMHPHTLSSMKSVAVYYTKMNWFEKACPISEETFKRSKEVLGSNHPLTYSAMHHLAVLYDRLKRFDEARPLYETCLKNRILTLGKYHPATLSLINTFTVHYKRQGLYEEALKLWSLEQIQEALGEDDMYTRKSIFWIADLCYCNGDLEESKRLFELYLGKVGMRSTDWVKDRYPSTAMKKLAKIYGSQGQHEKANAIREKLRNREKCNG